MKKDIVRRFWELIDTADFDTLREILEESADVWLPNTHEVFHGSEKYIIFNKKYPGRWFACVESLFETDENVISIVKISAEKESLDFYVTSVFSFSECKISEIKEYWGDNGEPPEWRLDEGLSEIY